MTGPSARTPLPGEPEHRDRWPDAHRPALTATTRAWLMVADGGRSRMAVQGTVADIRAALDGTADTATEVDWPAIVGACQALVRVYDDRLDTASDTILGSFLGHLMKVIPAAPSVAPQPAAGHGEHLVNASAPAMRKLLTRVYRGEWTVSDAVDVLHDWPNRAAPSVAPQPTVPRAPVEALLAALDQYSYDDPDGSIGAAYLEVRHHLDGDTT